MIDDFVDDLVNRLENWRQTMSDPLPCPCGENCSLSIQSNAGPWKVVAYPCGTEGPARGDLVVTEEDAIRAWNQWIAGIRMEDKDDE